MRTVFWEDNKVKMIDQRLLPGEFVIAEFDSVEDVARSIKEMYVRGAPAIGATGAFGMVSAITRSAFTAGGQRVDYYRGTDAASEQYRRDYNQALAETRGVRPR